MLPYLLVLSFVMCWIALEQKVLNRKSFWLPLIVLSLFSGVRSYRVGTDSGAYVRKFNNQLDIAYFEFNKTGEIAYQLLEYTLLTLTKNYFWLFFITGLIIVYCYLNIIKKYSVNYCFSIFLFITLGTYTFFFNGLRQGMAMALFVLATPYLLKKNFAFYLLICCLASLFHVTALFMIPFYFIVNLNIKPIYKVFFTFLGSLVTSRFLVAYVASTDERYEGYTEVSDKAGGLLILSFHIFLTFFIYIVGYIYKIKEDRFTKLLTFYAVGVFFIIPLAMLGTNPSGPQRLLSYFSWTLVLLLPIVTMKINNKYISIVAATLALIYFILTTSRFSSLTPYTLNPVFEIF